MTAELPGFRKASYEAVARQRAGPLRLDFELGVGELSEAVTVSGRAELLQTQSADIGNVVDERQVRDLPLLGRRYSELAFLSPGVVVAPAGITSRGEDTFFNANGNFATWNNYTLDGADNNSFSTNLQERSPQVVQPPVDALQEFKVQTRTYSAEFGKAAGAVINASVKQGTNAFRGSVFEFFRDEALQRQHLGQQPRRPAKGRVQPAHRRLHARRAGAARPHLLLRRLPGHPHRPGAVADRHRADDADAHRRLERADRGGRRVQPVRAGRLLERHDPARRRVVHRSGGGAGSSSSTPLPNVPGDGFFNNNFISNGVLNNDVNQFDVRLDHAFGSGNDNVFARYSYQQTDRVEPPLLNDPVASGDFASNYLIRGQNMVGGWSSMFDAGVGQRVPRRLQPCPLRRGAPVVRRRLQRASTA